MSDMGLLRRREDRTEEVLLKVDLATVELEAAILDLRQAVEEAYSFRKEAGG